MASTSIFRHMLLPLATFRQKPVVVELLHCAHSALLRQTQHHLAVHPRSPFFPPSLQKRAAASCRGYCDISDLSAFMAEVEHSVSDDTQCANLKLKYVLSAYQQLQRTVAAQTVATDQAIAAKDVAIAAQTVATNQAIAAKDVAINAGVAAVESERHLRKSAEAVAAFHQGLLHARMWLEQEEGSMGGRPNPGSHKQSKLTRDALWNQLCKGPLRKKLDKCIPTGKTLGRCVVDLYGMLSEEIHKPFQVGPREFEVRIPSSVPDWGQCIVETLGSHHYGRAVTVARLVNVPIQTSADAHFENLQRYESQQI